MIATSHFWALEMWLIQIAMHNKYKIQTRYFSTNEKNENIYSILY